jgi:hypothetical protein
MGAMSSAYEFRPKISREEIDIDGRILLKWMLKTYGKESQSPAEGGHTLKHLKVLERTKHMVFSRYGSRNQDLLCGDGQQQFNGPTDKADWINVV